MRVFIFRVSRDRYERSVGFLPTRTDTVTYRRAKDQGTPTGEWMADLVSENPWFKELLPNVRQSKTKSAPLAADRNDSSES